VTRTFLYVANPLQLAEIAVGAHGATHEMPPGGASRGYDVHGPGGIAGVDVVSGITNLYVSEIPLTDQWFWGTLGEFLTGLSGIESAALDRLVRAVASLAGVPVGAALSAPLLLKGTAGTQMRWIRTTYRGILGGGVEQFQFKIDLGNPGSDPDLDEADCLALAEQLAGIIGANPGGLMNQWSVEAALTEVGAVTMTATDATDSSGEGGNMAQSFPTQWFMYPTGSRPAGLGSGDSLPYEVACAVSLQTDHRGPSGRGRFYLPPFATQAMTGGGVYDATAMANALEGSVALLHGIIAATPYVPLVVSPRRLILNEVTSVNVGHVPDSQRRRRRSQAEARVVTVL
jgi:hypothetical protein